MSTTRATVTVICDWCYAPLPTLRTTTAGARGDASRKGWRTSQKGDGYHGAGASADFDKPDQCPDCQPKPEAEGGLW